MKVVFEICDCKKCLCYVEWVKLFVDDLCFEMSNNLDDMCVFDKEEMQIRE